MTKVRVGALCWNQLTEWPARLEAGVPADALGTLWTWVVRQSSLGPKGSRRSPAEPGRTLLARGGHLGDNDVMNPTLVFSESVDHVDWRALKAALAADNFDNGRTPEEYEASHRGSYGVVFAKDGEAYIGNARILSDGVCNAYLVDVWTAAPYRRRGIGSELVRRLLAMVPGQHVYLFTDDMQVFYRRLGFEMQPDGMGQVVGSWLSRPVR